MGLRRYIQKMKFNNNYREIIFEKEDIVKAKKRQKESEQYNTKSINPKEELQGKFGEIATEFLLKRIHKFLNWEKQIDNNTKVAGNPNIQELTKNNRGKLNKKEDYSFHNNMQAKYGLGIEAKSKRITGKRYYQEFKDKKIDILFSLRKNDFKQIKRHLKEGITFIWGIYYYNNLPDRAYCFMFTNREIYYMLNNLNPVIGCKTDEEYSNIIKHIENKYGKGNPGKFMQEQANKVWDENKIKAVFNNSHLDSEEIILLSKEGCENMSCMLKENNLYIEEPFYKLAIEFYKLNRAHKGINLDGKNIHYHEKKTFRSDKSLLVKMKKDYSLNKVNSRIISNESGSSLYQ